jgi:16S rRNA (uracil1498-N3)-methyltransferase
MPTSIRLFMSSDLAAETMVDLAPGQAHYLNAVMRRSVGDPVVLFNGRDGEWDGRIEFLRKDRARLSVVAPLRPQAPEPDLWLVFAVLKTAATELVVQKATELGASRIMLAVTERTNVPRANVARLHAIAVEAAEQCERLTVPGIVGPSPLRAILCDWASGDDDARPLFAAIERASAPSLRPVSGGPAALLVGPEGGFTAAELDGLAAHAFVRAASLGPRILRAETAAIVGLALLQAHTGG